MQEVFERYDVNEDGVVTNKRTGVILAQHVVRNGYVRITIYLTGMQKKIISVHRMVAYKYIPNPDNKTQVNHIDGNKLNNNVSNLEWCTKSENTIHAYANGLMKKICREVQAIDKITGDIICEYESIANASRDTGATSTRIIECCRGRLKSTAGFKWKYKE